MRSFVPSTSRPASNGPLHLWAQRASEDQEHHLERSVGWSALAGAAISGAMGRSLAGVGAGMIVGGLVGWAVGRRAVDPYDLAFDVVLTRARLDRLGRQLDRFRGRLGAAVGQLAAADPAATASPIPRLAIYSAFMTATRELDALDAVCRGVAAENLGAPVDETRSFARQLRTQVNACLRFFEGDLPASDLEYCRALEGCFRTPCAAA